MNQENPQKPNNFHLAGLIPVEAQPLDFKLPLSDGLIPVGKDYLAVERAVYECAIVGCETIWIICSKETTPLIRQRLGDWIHDPTTSPSHKKHLVYNPSDYIKQIPIFYVPIHPKDKLKRNSLSWSIIYGYNRAYKITRKFTRWATPSKYYVAFPHGVYSPLKLQKYRKLFSTPKNTFVTHNNKTAKDGELLAFTFDSNDYRFIKKAFRENEQRLYRNALWKDGQFTGEMLPVKERYTGRFIPLSTILKYMKIEDGQQCEIEEYYDISSWEKYCVYMGSSLTKVIKRPTWVLNYHEFNPIGEDVEDETGNGEPKEEIDFDYE